MPGPDPSAFSHAGYAGYQYQWQDGSTGGSYTANAPGQYYLTATNTCGSYTDSVMVSTGNCTVYMPSAFTPNGDGLNDVFRTLGTGLIDQFELSIFDRAGQLLFRTMDKTKGWDGKYKGLAQPAAVYIYRVSYTEAGDTKRKMLKGTLALLR